MSRILTLLIVITLIVLTWIPIIRAATVDLRADPITAIIENSAWVEEADCSGPVWRQRELTSTFIANASTKLLLHFNGVGYSHTFTDSAQGLTATTYGAHIKNCGESGETGSADFHFSYITFPAASYWGCVGVDCAVKLRVVCDTLPPASAQIIGEYAGDVVGDPWSMYLYSDGRLCIGRLSLNEVCSASGTFQADTWYEIEVNKNNSTSRIDVYLANLNSASRSAYNILNTTTAILVDTGNPLTIGAKLGSTDEMSCEFSEVLFDNGGMRHNADYTAELRFATDYSSITLGNMTWGTNVTAGIANIIFPGIIGDVQLSENDTGTWSDFVNAAISNALYGEYYPNTTDLGKTSFTSQFLGTRARLKGGANGTTGAMIGVPFLKYWTVPSGGGGRRVTFGQ